MRTLILMVLVGCGPRGWGDVPDGPTLPDQERTVSCFAPDVVPELDLGQVPADLPEGLVGETLTLTNHCDHGVSLGPLTTAPSDRETFVRFPTLASRWVASGRSIDVELSTRPGTSSGALRNVILEQGYDQPLGVVRVEVHDEPRFYGALAPAGLSGSFSLDVAPGCGAGLLIPLQYHGDLPVTIESIELLGGERWSLALTEELPVSLGAGGPGELVLSLNLAPSEDPGLDQAALEVVFGSDLASGAPPMLLSLRPRRGAEEPGFLASIDRERARAGTPIPLGIIPDPDSLRVMGSEGEIAATYDPGENTLQLDQDTGDRWISLTGMPACL